MGAYEHRDILYNPQYRLLRHGSVTGTNEWFRRAAMIDCPLTRTGGRSNETANQGPGACAGGRSRLGHRVRRRAPTGPPAAVAGDARAAAIAARGAGDRATLMALYGATDGPNWTKRDNWGSDRPLGRMARRRDRRRGAGDLAGPPARTDWRGRFQSELGDLSAHGTPGTRPQRIVGSDPTRTGAPLPSRETGSAQTTGSPARFPPNSATLPT